MGPSGFMLFAKTDHGSLLRIAGQKRKAIQYVVGNPLFALQMTQHDIRASLYAPLRVLLYENEEGKTCVEYDKPTSLFGQFGHVGDQRHRRHARPKASMLSVEHGGGGVDLLRGRIGRRVKSAYRTPRRSFLPRSRRAALAMGVKARPDVVLRHLQGKQRIADDVLDCLSLLARDSQQRPVIGLTEQHEAARSHHRLDLTFGFFGVSTPSERLRHVRVE